MNRFAGCHFAIIALLLPPLANRAFADPPNNSDPSKDIFNMKKPGSKKSTPEPATDMPAQPTTSPSSTTQPTTMPVGAPATAPTRFPIPTPIEQAVATRLIHDLYAKDFAAAGKIPDKLGDLAEKLCQAGHDEATDHAAQFVSFSTARDLATTASDLRLAWRAVDEQSAHFDVDTAKLKVAAALAIGRITQPTQDRRLFALQVLGLSDELVKLERFDLVSQLDELVRRVGSGDAGLGLQIRNAVAEHGLTKTAYLAATEARAVLKTDLINGPANVTFGTYCCFVQDDWEHGLPWLAAGNDSQLRAAAATEIAGVTTPESQFALGENWWAIAGLESPSSKRRIQLHAARFYHLATAGLAGLSKMKLDKRMNEIQAIEQLSTPQAVDLLSLVDPDRDSVEGTWNSAPAGTIASSVDDRVRIALPYTPPLEYDYHVVFTRTFGNDSLDCICIGGPNARQFLFSLGAASNTLAGFGEVNTQGPRTNPTTTRGRWIDNGRRHTLIVQVRAAGVAAFLDDRPVSAEYRTNFRDMALFYKNSLKRTDVLGLQAVKSIYTIHSAFIVEVKGHGHAVHADEPDQPPVAAVVSYTGWVNNRQPFVVTLYENGTAHSTLNTDATWFLHGSVLMFRWNDAVDTCQLAANHRSFIGKTQKGDIVKGEVTDGEIGN